MVEYYRRNNTHRINKLRMIDKELIESMAHKNGKRKINCKLREELAELSLAIARIDYAVVANEDTISKIDNFHEEFVDVEIMMSQMKTLLNQEVYILKREEKLEHIKQLLNADV